MRNLFLSLSRMPPFLMLLIIVGLAVTATMLYTQQSSKKDQEIAQIKAAHELDANAKSNIVYALKDIPEGMEITADALGEKEELTSKIPTGAMSSTSAGVGMIAAYPIQSGQTVLQNAVKPRAMQAGFEGKIREGMRAVTFGIDPNAGVAGFVSPGSHVDILCITGGGADTKAAPVLSDVEVIAVGTTYRKAPGETTATQASSVTALVNPEDAEKLVKAVNAGKPYLTLRNEKDHQPLATVDITALFPKPAKAEDAGGEVASSLPPPSLPPPPLPGAPGPGDAGAANAPPPPPPMHEIELWSGSKKEVLSVPQG
ncbi:MAG: Flp pilus assembly protein CpaB [Candidatus Obscuribacterales bacterium]|nr:Flp pilus assembly protein CpaB [Candidatus Obscuribacterales bacterium]